MNSGLDGFVGADGLGLLRGLVVVLYPYVTGVATGIFILASWIRLFNVRSLVPAYRPALLAALALLLCAVVPAPFLGWLPSSGDGFVSASAPAGGWFAAYVLGALLLELWFDYRTDLVQWGRTETGVRGRIYRLLTFGVKDLSPRAELLDETMSVLITVLALPSAFLLHGYASYLVGSGGTGSWFEGGFMPVSVAFSALPTGVASSLLLYAALCHLHKTEILLACLDGLGRFLFWVCLVCLCLGVADVFVRLSSGLNAAEPFRLLIAERPLYALSVFVMLVCTQLPLLLLGVLQLARSRFRPFVRERLYVVSALLVLLGVCMLRSNARLWEHVTMGGQAAGMHVRMLIVEQGNWLGGLAFLVLPFVALAFLVVLFLPENGAHH